MVFFEKGDGGAYGQVSGIGASYDAWGATQIRDPAGNTWDRNVYGQFSPSKRSGGSSFRPGPRSDGPPTHFWILLSVWAVCGLIWLAVYVVQNNLANPCSFFSPNVCLENHDVFHRLGDRGTLTYALSADRAHLYLVEIDNVPDVREPREQYRIQGWRISDGQVITPAKPEWVEGSAHEHLAVTGIELFPDRKHCMPGCPMQETSRNGTRHAIARDNRIRVIDTADYTVTQEIDLGDTSSLWALAFSQDGTQLITYVSRPSSFFDDLLSRPAPHNLMTFEVQ